MEDVPEGWVVWNDDPGGRLVLVYRPDVFDADRFDAACLPTIYVRRKAPGQRKRRRNPVASDDWYVTLFLEPEVRVRAADSAHADHGAAIEAARDLARAFAAGDVDYRESYQLPRETYLDALDELTGRE
ncbi:MAG: DUF5820 family protein [Haloarculaceae archaeon]